jgi:hypothetical protein
MSRQDRKRYTLYVLVAGLLATATWGVTFAHTRQVERSALDALVVFAAGLVCCAVCDDEDAP